jgi:hypothetical protein
LLARVVAKEVDMRDGLRRVALTAVTLAAFLGASVPAQAAPIYLNEANISVALGPNMEAEPFANRTAADSLASIIDADSAAAGELHNQQTHVWVSGGILELVFDFGAEYDLSAIHFWNYFTETYDVDDIDLEFFDGDENSLGEAGFNPQLGNAANDGTPILAENVSLNFPTNVRYVSAILSGSNSQVDFNNMGFTGELSETDPDPDVPEPATLALLAFGLAVAARRFRTR